MATNPTGTPKPMPVLLAAAPAYSIGLLLPAPFIRAAVENPSRRRVLTAVAYVIAWIGVWTLVAVTPDNAPDWQATLCGLYFLVLVFTATAHAFILRASLSRETASVHDQPLVHPERTTTASCAQARAAVADLKSRLARHQPLPGGCARLFDTIVADVEQVLAFVAREGHADRELRSVQSIVTDYLPDSIDTYLRLPPEYARRHRNPDGRTPSEELELQLGLLRDGAEEAAASLYGGESLRLQEQSTFLQAKFGRSELDLSPVRDA